MVILIRELADSLLLPFDLLQYVGTLKEAWKNLEEKVQESLKDDKGVDREGYINSSLSEMRDDDTFIGILARLGCRIMNICNIVNSVGKSKKHLT